MCAGLLVRKDSAGSSCSHSVKSRLSWSCSVRSSRYCSPRNCFATRWFVLRTMVHSVFLVISAYTSHSVHPVIGHSRDPSPSRYDSVLSSHLWIGHTRLTNSYLLKGKNQPECQIFHSPLTVKHILIDCTCFGAAHQRWYTQKNLSKTLNLETLMLLLKMQTYIVVCNDVFLY